MDEEKIDPSKGEDDSKKDEQPKPSTSKKSPETEPSSSRRKQKTPSKKKRFFALFTPKKLRSMLKSAASQKVSKTEEELSEIDPFSFPDCSELDRSTVPTTESEGAETPPVASGSEGPAELLSILKRRSEWYYELVESPRKVRRKEKKSTKMFPKTDKKHLVESSDSLSSQYSEEQTGSTNLLSSSLQSDALSCSNLLVDDAASDRQTSNRERLSSQTSSVGGADENILALHIGDTSVTLAPPNTSEDNEGDNSAPTKEDPGSSVDTSRPGDEDES